MERLPRRTSIQLKLSALVIGSILVVAAGLMLISYYIFCQRVDERFEHQLQRAAQICAESTYPVVIEHLWNEINTEEFRAVRDRAEAAGDEQMLLDWMRGRPGWIEALALEQGLEEDIDPEDYWTLETDYLDLRNKLVESKSMLDLDAAYYQYSDGLVTYNILDPDESVFYLGTVEEPLPEFENYPGNVAVPPVAYRSAFGWLYTAVEPIADRTSGQVVGTVGVDLNMTTIVAERYMFLRQGLIFVAALLALSILISFLLLRRTAVRPLRMLAEGAMSFAKGDRAFTREDVLRLDLRSNDEIGDLYREIRAMEERIVEYTEHLTSATAEKERVRTELRTAAHIQESMLPGSFPAFPEREDFALYASMTPAKEVGGDFYDFFLIDSDHLAVLIADVSDKGVPAALFMMSAKILIQYRAQMGGSPSEILGAVNAEICKSNKAKMFVTVWMGILDLETGVLTCANAGHEYPAVRGPDGVFRLRKDPHGLVVGALARSKYRDYEIRMQPGDAIFVYTDGVPEANNAAGEFYGLERMEATLNRLSDRDPQGLLEGIKADVDAFTGEADQFDDLTMLGLEYRGKGKKPAAE